MNFEFLVNSIQQTHTALQQSAVKAINRHITIRNWLIGFYIFEYDELHNIDMQVPPDKLVSRLSFSHFAEMFEIKEPLKRTFYELECIKGNRN